MKNFLIISASLLFFNLPISAQTEWKIDPVHSSIQFDVAHLVVSTVTGSFTSFEGILKSEGNNFEGATVTCSLDVNGIDTENLTRDKHLKEDDFFNAAKFPKIIFKSIGFKKVGDQDYIVEGELTIRDVTKKVTFNASNRGTVDTGSKVISAFKVSGLINRFDFGLRWDDTLDSGSLVVGENVEIRMNLELVAL